MRIVNRRLTLNQNVANRTVECISGCRIELDPLEVAGLALPGNRGFTLRCVLQGDDPGNPDPVIFTYATSKTFGNLLDIINTDHVFRADVSDDIINEDANGSDEIRARFTLVNNGNGQSVARRSPQVAIDL